MNTPTVTHPGTVVTNAPAPGIARLLAHCSELVAQALKGFLGDQSTISRSMSITDRSRLFAHAQAERMARVAVVPADEVVWGYAVKDGFDELDDPWYHRGVTQHGYLEGNDLEALCGFRPPLSGPRERRQPRLALPTPGVHPMCAGCSRRVGPPRHRVAIPVAPQRGPVPMPMGASRPMGVPGRMPVPAGRRRG